MRGHIAVALALGAAAAGAQQPRTWAAVWLGAEQSEQHNPAESPYTYGGFGANAGALVVRERASSHLDLSFSYSQATLHSAMTRGGAPNTALEAATVDVHYGRVVGPRAARVRWLLGAGAAGRVEDSRHQYADPTKAKDDFGFVSLGLGPYVRAELPIRGARLTNDLTLPVASWIEYPYSNAAGSGQSAHLRFASLNAARIVDDVVRYRAGPIGRAGLTWAYRFSYHRYAAADVRVNAHQSLSVALDFALGRAHR